MESKLKSPWRMAWEGVFEDTPIWMVILSLIVVMAWACLYTIPLGIDYQKRQKAEEAVMRYLGPAEKLTTVSTVGTTEAPAGYLTYDASTTTEDFSGHTHLLYLKKEGGSLKVIEDICIGEVLAQHPLTRGGGVR